MTIFSKNLGRHGPFGPPDYAYACVFLFLVVRHFLIIYSSYFIFLVYVCIHGPSIFR